MEFLKRFKYPVIIVFDYIISFLVVKFLIRTTIGSVFALPDDKKFYYILLSALTILLAVIYFLLKRSDKAFEPRNHKMRLVMETGSGKVTFGQIAMIVWSVLLLCVVVGFFWPVFPISNLPSLFMSVKYSTNLPYGSFYDPLVLHQLLIILIVYQFLRELYRLTAIGKERVRGYFEDAAKRRQEKAEAKATAKSVGKSHNKWWHLKNGDTPEPVDGVLADNSDDNLSSSAGEMPSGNPPFKAETISAPTDTPTSGDISPADHSGIEAPPLPDKAALNEAPVKPLPDTTVSAPISDSEPNKAVEDQLPQ